MPFRHPFTIALTLVALLLSNVAGWVHVGGCSTGGVSHSADLVHCHADRFRDGCSGAGNRVVRHCHCDATACDDDAKTGEAPVGGDAPCSPSSHVPGEHHSDHCSICQHFLSSRDLAVVDQPDEPWKPASVLAVCASFSSDVPAIFLGCLQVRGPPRV